MASRIRVVVCDRESLSLSAVALNLMERDKKEDGDKGAEAMKGITYCRPGEGCRELEA
jgi:hypothetical protein